jgi:hypothetical protein
VADGADLDRATTTTGRGASGTTAAAALELSREVPVRGTTGAAGKIDDTGSGTARATEAPAAAAAHRDSTRPHDPRATAAGAATGFDAVAPPESEAPVAAAGAAGDTGGRTEEEGGAANIDLPRDRHLVRDSKASGNDPVAVNT